MKIHKQESERHVLAITVDNEAGILAKIAGLFTARGYNIDSLTVADITENHSASRITIVTNGPPAQIDQIHARLERLVPGQITRDGELIIAAQRFRSQLRNREDALERLATLVREARRVPKPRIASRPSQTQKRKRRENKRLHGAQKKLRGRPDSNAG